MNLLANYSDEQIAGLMEGLTSELAERKRKREEEKKNRITFTVSFAEMAAAWKYRRATAKIALCDRYQYGDWEVYVARAPGGDTDMILGLNKYTQRVMPFAVLPAEARFVQWAE